MIVGVTGLIGSGKSEVAGVFSRLGARLIDCDLIGREVVESNHPVLYRLVMTFGGGILRKDMSLDRRELGRRAFASPENTKRLNAIVHPALLAELDLRMSKAREKGYNAVVDAALLIYWNYHRKVDYTIAVNASLSNRIKRLTRAGLTHDEIRMRTQSQLSWSYLRERADIVLFNNDDIETLRKKAEMLYRRLLIPQKG